MFKAEQGVIKDGSPLIVDAQDWRPGTSSTQLSCCGFTVLDHVALAKSIYDWAGAQSLTSTGSTCGELKSGTGNIKKMQN